MAGLSGGIGANLPGRVVLALAEPDASDLIAAPWIGPIVALGGMARRYAEQLNERQLVVVLSVPRRDFAAVLLACGWVISAPPPRLARPEDLLSTMSPGTPVRAMTAQFIFKDFFEGLEEGSRSEVRFRRSRWMSSHLLSAAPLPGLDEPCRAPSPPLGALGRWKGLERSWNDRLVSPDADLALIGTASRLNADLGVRVAPHSVSAPGGEIRASAEDSIGSLLLPQGQVASTHFCTIHAAARLADELPLAATTRAVVLDGFGAIKYLNDIEAPFVFCVLDRSIANEASADHLVQSRNTRGDPVSLADAVGWRAPAGVEAMAFTTRL